jgi:hypothetical protein
MHLLFVPREGIDLYRTLVESETSRQTLRFYRPERIPCGVLVRASSLGSAVSLASELKWYIARYMRDVLFEMNGDIYCTWALAGLVYERNVRLQPPWEFRFLYAFREGQLVQVTQMEPGRGREEYLAGLGENEKVLEVWAAPSDLEKR